PLRTDGGAVVVDGRIGVRRARLRSTRQTISNKISGHTRRRIARMIANPHIAHRRLLDRGSVFGELLGDERSSAGRDAVRRADRRIADEVVLRKIPLVVLFIGDRTGEDVVPLQAAVVAGLLIIDSLTGDVERRPRWTVSSDTGHEERISRIACLPGGLRLETDAIGRGSGQRGAYP